MVDVDIDVALSFELLGGEMDEVVYRPYIA
jgi:hypothetical protein